MRSRVPHLVKRFRVLLALVAVCFLGSAGALVAVSASTAAGCTVSYSVGTQWNVGFTASITITNTGTPVSSWSLRYKYPGNGTPTAFGAGFESHLEALAKG